MNKLLNLENILEMIVPRPSFWLRAWMFLFTLVNRKEGKRMITELTEKVDENIRKSNEAMRKIDEFSKRTDERLAAMNWES
jgi:hypothetical protein